MRIDLSSLQFGNYNFRHWLGGGGAADVWLCDQIVAGGRKVARKVATKVFSVPQKDRAGLQVAFEDFQKDFLNLTKMYQASPIVRYFDTQIGDAAKLNDGSTVTLSRLPEVEPNVPPPEIFSLFMIMMEFADGGSLEKNYRTEILLNEDYDHLSHFKDICVALRSAHDRGIVHSDVKPANLFWFKKDNQVRLGDFGIAVDLTDNLPQAGFAIGTPPYMAPEVFVTHVHTFASDIYALGCTFYELYTGQKAISPSMAPTGTLPEVGDIRELYKQLHQELERPDAIRFSSELSVSLSGLIKRMMAVDPKSRPNLNDVIEELERERINRSPAPVNTGTIVVPNVPSETLEIRSTHLVSPLVRRKILGEFACLLLIDVQPKTDSSVSNLFAYLEAHFGKTYSCWEVFGENSFFVRVWVKNEAKIEKFVSALKRDVFRDITNSSIKVMPCEEVLFMHCNPSTDITGIEKVELLLHLNQAQTWSEEESKAWLIKKKVYCAAHRTGRSKQSIKCFSFLKSLRQVDEQERETQTAVLQKAIRDSELDTKKFQVSVYRKSYSQIKGIKPVPSDHLISFLAPKHSEVRKIPEIILKAVEKKHQIFNTTTVLTTGAYVVESHKVDCN